MSTENLIWTALGASAAWVVIVAKILSWTVKTSLELQLSKFREELRLEFSTKFQDPRQLDSRLTEFREQMRSEFANRFQDQKVLEARLLPMVEEIQRNRTKIIEVEEYAHHWKHAHANAIQRCILKNGLDTGTDEL